MGNCQLDVVWQRIEEGTPAHVLKIHLEGIRSEALTRLKCAWLKPGNPKLYLIISTKNTDPDAFLQEAEAVWRFEKCSLMN
jgi:23S rRNA pseudoU1915 N3-methylase RlmH